MKNCTKVRAKYQTPKIQFNRIATAKDRIPELKIPRMCQNPWLGLIIRLRIPLNELKKIKRRELTCP